MPKVDVLCLGIAWDQPGPHRQLLEGCAREHRVFFVEEPVPAASHPFVTMRARDPELCIVTPHVRAESGRADQDLQLRGQLTMLALDRRIVRPILWYMHPGRAPALRGLPSSLVIYGPPSPLVRGASRSPQERALLEDADLILHELPAPTDSPGVAWRRIRPTLRAVLMSKLQGVPGRPGRRVSDATTS
jgi:hypothetical protein